MLQGFFTISDAGRRRSKLLLEVTRAGRREEEREGAGWMEAFADHKETADCRRHVKDLKRSP